MIPSAQSIDIHDVEHAISDRFTFLRFKPALERQFETDAGAERCACMIRHNYIGIFIYHCFLYGDHLVVRDAFYTDLFMHFAVMTPVMIVTNYVLARQPPAWLREGLEAVAVGVLTLTIVLVVAASREPNRDIVQLTIVLVILFATVMQRLRFWYVVATCVAAQIVYSVGLTTLDRFSMERTMMANSVFLGILLFSVVGAYNLEHEQRTSYLLRMRDKFRNRELELISLRDALTGIGNRRALEAAVALLMKNNRMGSPRSTAVLLLDIDHFKVFNDTNGHQEGDLCLKHVASLVAASLRAGEGTAYRFGGEEFLVLLDDVSLNEAVVVAERVRSAVAWAEIPHFPTAPTFVTISVGVAAGILGETSPDSLIAAADGALYRAKRKGRDQVSSSFDGATPPSFMSQELHLAS